MNAQSSDCTFDKPVVKISFGTSGNLPDFDIDIPYNYERVRSYCPSDGHYTFTPYTSDCFGGDWFTVQEDHTAGDASGNMMLINSSYPTGVFFRTTVSGLKGGTIYEFAVWLMNVCRPSEKCPYPLLPDITIILQTLTGKAVAKFGTGEIVRHHAPQWGRYKAIFTTPPSETSLVVTMTNSNPGGCGNDFALDDITFRECIKPPPVVKTEPKTNAVEKKQPPPVKPVAKKSTPVTSKKSQPVAPVANTTKDSKISSPQSAKPKLLSVPPLVLRTRENNLVKKIVTEPGEIKVSLYDNGQIDEDTVSIYHNNVLLISHARLSEKPISLSITIDPSSPHHELVMVAENLGSIPPNTSLMIVTVGTKRYEVFISSSEQKNAKVVFDLKE